MTRYIAAFFAALVPLLMLDGAWLSIMGPRFYKPWLGALMADTPSWWPVAVFYPIYAIGLLCFVIWPAMGAGSSLLRVFLTGAFFGFVAYAAYDFTNQATLRDWPLAVTLVDLAWGTFLAGASSAVAVAALRYFA